MGEPIIQTAAEKRQRIFVRWPKLPLAVYREIVAHLRQVEQVETELLPVPPDQPFDYHLSQVGGLGVFYPEDIEAGHRQRIEQILAYYSHKYGDFERLSV